MSDTNTKSPLGDVPDALRRLLRAEVDLGRSLIESVLGTPFSTLKPAIPVVCGCGKSNCEIPPPCWMPRPLGERTSHVSPCSDVCLEFEVENCGLEAHPVKVAVRGYDQVVVTPSELVLGPLERGRITVCASVPKGVKTGTVYDATVIVAGCRIHYLRWSISVGTFGLPEGPGISIKDCPDYIHHWYDHFYCPRPCGKAAVRPARPGKPASGGPITGKPG